ncbi:MAG: proline dehydrogenase family protein [Bacteroidia bacterium]|nr:proline dehydrogenase family protein [Bacteroidia bacterium]
MSDPVSFDDTQRAFVARNDRQLRKAGWLFKLMARPGLVRFFSGATRLALRVGMPIRRLIRGTIFEQFCGGETLEESKAVVSELHRHKVGSILDYSVEGEENTEDLESTREEILRIIKSAEKNPAIPYTSVKLTGLMPSSVLEKANDGTSLTGKDLEEWNTGTGRIRMLCEAGRSAGVPIYFDAEESWIQNSIDRIAEELMPVYNKEKAIVLTTLQMYRWDRLEYLNALIARARSGNFRIGIKLVRGAYMEKENNRAAEKGYRSPIHTSKEGADTDFDKAVEICLRNVDLITLCAGTHNEASTLFLVRKMAELGIPNNHPNVYSSQLYGMSDHITYNLADKGYNVTKYVPYGPVKSVIPYLIRRAEENTAIAGQMGRELRLILEEKERRKQQALLPQGHH